MGVRELRIHNIAVIEDATAAFDDGFAVLTGETGSGKSICVNALRAVIGEKVDASVIRRGATSARVTAVFDDNVSTELRDELLGLGIEADEFLTISREISSGRSVFRINGSLVSGAVARRVGSELVEVTTQGVSNRLSRQDWQRSVVDAAAPTIAELRATVRQAVKAWNSAVEEIKAVQAAAAGDAVQYQRAAEVISDLEPLNLRSEERDELLAERALLRHAVAISAAARGLQRAMTGDDDAVGAADAVARAVADADHVRAFAPEVDRLCVAADDLMARLREVARDARDVSEQVLTDDARLSIVESRLDTIARIERRYGSIAEALAELDRAQRVVSSRDHSAGLLQRATQRVQETENDVATAALGLRVARKSAVRRLEKTVTANLRDLNLPHARFRVVLSELPDDAGVVVDEQRVRCMTEGADVIEFRISTHRDSLPMPLDDGPSGGELSRLALAIRAAVVADDCPTLVLDEVDTGIGGESAAKVGEMLAAIGHQRQVIAVTHRAEIAARANHHLYVQKGERKGRPVTAVSAVVDDDRIVEMARLLSGRQTDAAHNRARELLIEGEARRSRAV